MTPNALAPMRTRSPAARLEPLRTLIDTEQSKLPPTAEAKSIMQQWRGWGSLAPAFEIAPEQAWAEVADALEELLSKEDMSGAASVLDNSFYTPDLVVESVFTLLKATGFTNGRVLEPGCGSGRFMTQTPEQLAIDWTGVDLDPTACRFARALNPDATILDSKLETSGIRSNYFDAVVGNIPFSASNVYDPLIPSTSIHDYFIKRSLDAVKPGGYVIVVTSRHTVDSQSGLEDITGTNGCCDFIGAVRLPSNTFAESGISDVNTDIICLRKRTENESIEGLPAHQRSVRFSHPTQENRHTVSLSEYWNSHPSHVAGDIIPTGFSRVPFAIQSDNTARDIESAVRNLCSRLIPHGVTCNNDLFEDLSAVVLEDELGRKEGSFHLINDELFEIKNTQPVKATQSRELKLLVQLRDHALQLLELESDLNRPDAEIQPHRDRAFEAYKEYVDKFGPLNRGTLTEGKLDPDTGAPTFTWRRPALGGFRRDPDYMTTMALEVYNQDDGNSSPAPILLRRINKTPRPVERAESAAAALSIAHGEGRGVDLKRIAGLLGLESEHAAVKALGDLAFVDPETGSHVSARDYLSGNVRAKLIVAEAAETVDLQFARNADALRKVVPEDRTPMTIQVNLGSPVVTPEDINSFVEEELGSQMNYLYTASVGLWESQYPSHSGNTGSAARIEFGTKDLNPLQLLEHALNNKPPAVYREIVVEGRPHETKKVKDHPATLAAEEKIRALDERFSIWVWENEGRSNRICADYNLRFNSYVPKKFDGSHLIFPGVTDGFTPWKNQLDAVDRSISTPRALIAHPVGAGKSKTMVLTGRALKQFGLANKPLLVVPNHLLEQMVREAQQAFSTAKILVATKEDLTRERKRLFAARCATGDWDIVVMTHSAFTATPLDPRMEIEWIEAEKTKFRNAFNSVDSGGRRGAKAIATRLRSLETRLLKLRHNSLTDTDTVKFEQLGIDYLMIDEAHLFRRLDTGSTTRGSGFSLGSSKRATDLLLKIETLAARRPGKPIVSLYTATPWSNTLAETWVWQRMLQPEALEDAGVINFDVWVPTFIRYESNVEVSVDGTTFKVTRRPKSMKNKTELMTMLALVADIISADDIGLERPGSTIHNVVVDGTPRQLEFVRDLAHRADRLRNGGQITSGGKKDNMLLVGGDGRKVALDPSLVGVDEESAKLVRVAEITAKNYHDNKELELGQNGTLGVLQLLLCDLGTPHPGDSRVYGKIKTLLIDRGVPGNLIRYVHEAKTSLARAALFSQCRDGSVAVLLGSTSKVGLGTNIQTRLRAITHIDAPWTPAEVNQREGRGIRPNNLNPLVDIYRVVTEGTFDAFSWQTLERKERGFAALYSNDPTINEVEDIGSTALSYAEVKALAAGNPLLLEHATLNAHVQRLKLMRAVHLQSVNRAALEAKSLQKLNGDLENRLEEIEAVAKRFTAITPDLSVAAEKTCMRIAESITDGSRSRDYESYYLHSLRLNIKDLPYNVSRKGAARTVTVSFSYRDLWTVTFEPRTIRKGPRHLVNLLVEWVLGAVASAATEAIRISGDIKQNNSKIVELQNAAAAAVFSQEEELAASTTALEQLDQRISAEAAPESTATVHV
ncbi:DEAD/DEAH box helicase family protein [Lysinibacter cavernae]|uniref:DEAD/DEAH box helicase family protein n=1 Tax=Lysinibacter cavernae TaxID=1640652 RepID=UPI00360DA74C